MIAISARLAASRLHYAWVIIALTFVVIVVTAGVRATPGVLIVPFENEFHWSRATISFAIGINLLVYGLVGPFAAAAMDRFGVRRTMALSLVVAAAGVALSPLMYDPGSSSCCGAWWLGCPPALSARTWQPISPPAGFTLGRGWLLAF
jgi:MFS family permease